MACTYPNPQELGLKIPPTLRADRFSRGFDHALRGGQLDNVEYFRLSYRMGYRTAKLYLREVRRRRGILDFPMRARFRQKAIW
jgi:hypothetical protein